LLQKRTLRYFPIGIDVRMASGMALKATPNPTEKTVMKLRARTVPINEIQRPRRIARMAQMKNVLSPISERKISDNAAMNPDRPNHDDITDFRKIDPIVEEFKRTTAAAATAKKTKYFRMCSGWTDDLGASLRSLEELLQI